MPRRATPTPKDTIPVPVEREVFARNLRRARLAAGLSQQEVHARTGVAQRHISEIERGLRNPSLDLMASLAHAVGKPLHRLLTP